MLGDRGLVEAVLADHRTAPISEREKALFDFIEKVNRQSNQIRQDDVDRLKEAGWSDEAIYDAVTVCALFRFYNVWVDATGVHEMPEEAHLLSGRRLAARGYVPPDAEGTGRR